MIEQQSPTTEVSREEYEQLVQDVHDIRQRLDELEKRQDETDKHVQELEQRMDEVEAHTDSIRKLIISLVDVEFARFEDGEEEVKEEGNENDQVSK